MLVERVQSKEGGFDSLNRIVEDFRIRELPESIKTKLAHMKKLNFKEDQRLELVSRLKEPEPDVRKATVLALCLLPQDELSLMAASLASVLKHANSAVRSAAVEVPG